MGAPPDESGSRDSHEQAMAANAAALEGNADRYFEWNLGLFAIPPGSRILDIGCGPGLYFSTIMATAPELFVAVDRSPDYLEVMAELGRGHGGFRAMAFDLLDPDPDHELYGLEFDHLLCFDVIEHIEDDHRALATMGGILERTGSGRLCLRVPALMALYGENDRVIGHYRRYSRSSLRRAVERAGLEVEAIGYQNLVGIVPWLVLGRVLRRPLAVSESEGRLFDRLVPLIRAVERVVPPPLGLSLYCSCRLSA